MIETENSRMHSGDEDEIKFQNSKKSYFPTNTSRLPRRFHPIRQKSSGIKDRRGLSRAEAGAEAPAETAQNGLCPATPPHRPPRAAAANRRGSARRPPLRGGEGSALRDREAGGRRTSVSRPRKPDPPRKRVIRNPGLRAEHQRVPGQGAGRQGGPQPPAPSRSR